MDLLFCNLARDSLSEGELLLLVQRVKRAIWVLLEHTVHLSILKGFDGIDEEEWRKMLVFYLFDVLPFDDMWRLLEVDIKQERVVKDFLLKLCILFWFFRELTRHLNFHYRRPIVRLKLESGVIKSIWGCCDASTRGWCFLFGFLKLSLLILVRGKHFSEGVI
jgi:hypothetical protein